MKITTRIASLALAAMAACGPLSVGKPGANVAGLLLPSGAGAAQTAAAAVAPQPEFNRAFIEAQPADMLLVTIIDLNTSDVVIQAGTNGPRETWMNAEGIAISFQDGLMVGTRGLGDDLMGADVSGALASLRGGGSHTRTLEFLNGLDQIERLTFSCTTRVARSEQIEIFERTYQTSVIEEACSGADHSFTNAYWRDGSGVIWQSTQWVSPLVGFMAYRRL